MARRVSWTNNSSGHLGSYVYRAPTLDPQNLPAPVATVDPVAQGATAEWIDNEDLAGGDYDYAVQDFDGSGVGQVSAVAAYSVTVDYASAQVGDEIGGGIYAGTITYADARQFHIVFARQVDEIASIRWRTASSVSAAPSDKDDGYANTETLFNQGSHPAAEAIFGVTINGLADWYLPARNEISLYTGLTAINHPDFQTALTDERWTSNAAASVYTQSFDGGGYGYLPPNEFHRARPIRRVPA